MRKGLNRQIRFYICLVIGLMVLGACVPEDIETICTEMKAFERFSRINGDSLAIVPRKIRTEALRRMEQAKDSLAKYNYLAMVMKTYLVTTQLDSAQIMIRRLSSFIEGQEEVPGMADLESECFNMKGNVFARMGKMDSAEFCFRRSYERRMKGTKVEVIPDILMNLADASNRLGKLNVGAAWYRKALLMCDSLHLSSSKKPPIYYGLAQVYVTMRDFDLCDYYYNLAGESYDSMLPYEKYIYLNNRGTSYYYREDYRTAIEYFRKVVGLVEGYSDMNFELNLGRMNLGDCYLQLHEADSAVKYINECQPFFEKMDVKAALYYIDTQRIKLALMQEDFQEARRLLSRSMVPVGIDPDMVHIRNKYLQQFYEETGNYKSAYYYLRRNNQLDDSIRNERVRMHTADLTLRYQQDSTLMAHRVLLQEQKNEMLVLRWTQVAVFAIAVIAILTAFFFICTVKRNVLCCLHGIIAQSLHFVWRIFVTVCPLISSSMF